MKKKSLNIFVLSIALLSIFGLSSCKRQAYTYEITLNLNGGKGANNFTVEWGEELVLPTPTKEGYSFAGWFSESSFLTPYVEKTQVKDDMEFFAKWDINSYTITYDAHPGYFVVGEEVKSSIDTVATYNSTVNFEEVPLLEGYHFNGWYIDSSLTKVFDNRVPSKNLTVYAKYEEDVFTVYFDGNGASGRMNNLVLKQNSQNKILPDNAFSYTGKTFIGWNTKSDGSGTTYAENADISDLVKQGSMTLYAQWVNNEHTIKFIDENTKIYETTLRYGDDIPFNTVASPTREGETFAGWGVFKAVNDNKLSPNKHYYSKNGETYVLATILDYDTAIATNYYEIKVDPTLTKMIDDDLVLFACFEKNEITITFDSNGGSEVAPITTYVGNQIVEPIDPTKPGYVFVQWCKEEENDNGKGDVYSFDTLQTQSITLYAKWEDSIYAINFNSNLGEGSMDALTQVSYTQEVKLTKNIFTRAGYVFKYWNTKADGSGTTYEDEAIVSKLSVDGDITLFAIWEPTTVNYTVKHNLEKLDGGYDVISQTLSGVTLTNTNAIANEYFGFVAGEFEQTTIKADGTTVVNIFYARKDIIVRFLDGNDPQLDYGEFTAKYGDTRVVPTFAKQGYKYTLSCKGQTITSYIEVSQEKIEDDYDLIIVYVSYTALAQSGIMFENVDPGYENIEGLEGATVTVPDNPTRTGYLFAGWATEEEGEVDPTYVAGYQFVLGVYPTILYARYTPISYTVKFNLNNAIEGEQIQQINALYEGIVYLPGITLTRTGYAFNGWNTKSDGSGVHYNIGAEVKNLTTVNEAEVTLYAEWLINNYSITFMADGVQVAIITKPYGSTYKAEFDNVLAPSKTGYEFVGWYFGDSEFIVDDTSTIQASNIILNAKFEEIDITYTFHFKLQDGTEQTIVETYKFGQRPVVPSQEIDDIVNASSTDEVLVLLGWREGGFDSTSEYVKVDRIINDVNNKDFYADQKSYAFILRYLDAANGNILYEDKDCRRDINETYARYMAYSYILQAFQEAQLAILGQDGSLDKITVVALYFGTLLNPDNLETANIESAIYAATQGNGLSAVPELTYFYAVKDPAMLEKLATLAQLLLAYKSGDNTVLSDISDTMTAISNSIDVESLTSYLTKYGVYYAEANVYDPSLYGYIEDLYNKTLAYSYILDSLEAAIAGDVTELTKVLKYFGAIFGLDEGKVYNIYQALYNSKAPYYISSIDNNEYLEQMKPFVINVMTKNALGEALEPNDLEGMLTYTRFEKELYSNLYENYLKGGYSPYRDGSYAFDGYGVITYQAKDPVTGELKTYKNFYAKWIRPVNEVEGLLITPKSETLARVSWNEVEAAAGYIITIKINNNIFCKNEFTTLTYKDIVCEDGDEVFVEIYAVSENYDIETNTDLSSDSPLGIKFNSFEDGSELSQQRINLSSSKSTKLSYTFSYSTNVEVADVLDYLYHGYDNKGQEIYYFYPEHSYNFNKHTSVSIIQGAEIVDVIGTTIKTKDKVGQFLFYFDGDFTKKLTGYVLPYPEEITLGESFLNYVTVSQHANDGDANNNDYLNTEMEPYVIGISTSNAKYKYTNKYTNFDKNNYYNGFKFDFVIIGRAGSENVPINSVDFGLEYKFYDELGNELNQQQKDALFFYDEITDIFYFKAGENKANLGKIFTVKVTYKHDNASENYINTNVPNAYKGVENKENALSEEFTFTLNEGLNVSTLLEFRNAYEDSSVTLINLHSNIEARYNPDGVYYVGEGCPDWVGEFAGKGDCDIEDFTAVVTTNSDYKRYDIAANQNTENYVFIDVNGIKYVFNENGTYGLLDCRLLFNRNGKFKVNHQDSTKETYGNAACFSRENYERSRLYNVDIQGNYFTIDGSKLPFVKSDGSVTVAGIGNAEGYKVQNMHLFMFMMKGYEGTTTFNNMSVIGNNIDYATFVKDPRFAGMKENDYITITSGTVNSFYARGLLDYSIIDNAYVYDAHLSEGPIPITKMVLNNVNVNDPLIGLFVDGNGIIEANYSSFNDSWANTVYGYGAYEVKLNHCEIGNSGGAAIHIEDNLVNENIINPINPILSLDDYTLTHIKNNLTGGEQWFVAYQMSTLAIGMKVQLNGMLSGVGLKVTNKNEEINLMFLSKDENYKTNETFVMDENISTILGEPVNITAIVDPNTLQTMDVDPSNRDLINQLECNGAAFIYTLADGRQYFRFAQQTLGIYLIAVVELYPAV